MCRIDRDHYEDVSANAGCIIRVGQKVLTLNHRITGKLDVPGGTALDAEAAQCTAHRETWEETGFNVEVGEFLGENPRGFRFYSCELDGDYDDGTVELPVPSWSQVEVSSIQLVDPFYTSQKDWRYPDELVEIRRMFNDTN